jgi:uncharacterized membrane protein YdbT with pleckstrin-like domain
MVIRPSTKLLTIPYATAVVIAVGILVLHESASVKWQPYVYWLLVLPCVIALRTVGVNIQRRFTTLVVESPRLRYETGVLSRSTRNLELRKVQDVRSDQTLFQRILGIGDLSIETAGETSRLTIPNIDHPQRVAETILEAAHKLFEDDKKSGDARRSTEV